jgi:hypothetical protein
MAEELIKINPINLPYYYRFAHEFLTFEASSVPPIQPGKSSFRVNLYPKSLILSVYKYSTISYWREAEFRKLVGMEKVYPGTIGCGYLSLFKPVEVPSGVRPKMILLFSQLGSSGDEFKLDSIELDFGNPYSYTRYGTSLDEYFKRSKVEEHIKRLKRIEGKNFDETYKHLKSKIDDTIYYFERGLILIGNLFYNLLKGDFVSDVSLDRLVKTVRGYGDTLDEFFDNVIFGMSFSIPDPLV